MKTQEIDYLTEYVHFDAGEAVRNHHRRKAERRRKRMGRIALAFVNLALAGLILWGLQ